MSEVPALLTLAGGIVLVVAGAELFFDGVLALANRLGVSGFVLTAVVSGFELENLAAGIAANARGLGGAAAGTFLGGTTFLALGVACATWLPVSTSPAPCSATRSWRPASKARRSPAWSYRRGGPAATWRWP